MSHRRFRETPSFVFINEVRDRILQTGRPEDISELYHQRIAKTEEFIRLTQIDIEGTKRPDGDWANCPMCRPDQFLHGWLVHLPRLEAVAVIGHCCADKETGARADRDWAQRNAKKKDEDFLLKHLPRVPGLLRKLEQLQLVAKEAQDLHKKFLNQGGIFHRQLRPLRTSGGALVHHEVLDEEAVGDGPRAFGRGGNIREERLGTLSGLTALMTAYHPVRDLNSIKEGLAELSHGETEEAVLDFIVSLSTEDRPKACKMIARCDQQLTQVANRLRDFAAFFADDNIDRLAGWASHRLNRDQFYVSRGIDGKARTITMTGWGCKLKLTVQPILTASHPT